MIVQTSPSTLKKIAMTVADIGVIGLCAAFATAASNVSPAATGIAFAAITFPFLSSLAGIISRHHPLSANAPELSNGIGLQLARRGLKNIFKEAKQGDFTRAVVAAGLMGTIGLASCYMASESEKTTQRHEAFLKLPVLPGDTLIRAEELCNFKRNIPFDRAFEHNGTNIESIVLKRLYAFQLSLPCSARQP